MKASSILKEIGKSLIIAIGCMVLFFPLMVMKVNVTRGVAHINFRWNVLPLIGIVAFVLSFVWSKALEWNEKRASAKTATTPATKDRQKATARLPRRATRQQC